MNILPILAAVFTGMMLCGCSTSTSSIYNGVLSQTENELNHLENAASGTARLSLGEMLYNFATGAKTFAPAVIAGSMAVGILLLLIVRKERTWRKTIIGFFIIGIPLLMFIISYGLAILVTMYTF